jgi:hypothetical protein
MTADLLNRYLVIVLFLFAGSSHNNSLAFSHEDFSRRHFFGTYIGVELGLINQFEGSLLSGYRITPRLHAGIGAKYQYFHDRQVNQMVRTHIFGPFVFSDFILVKDLNEFLPFRFIEGAFFLHGEMNYFSLPGHFDPGTDSRDRFFRPTWLTGAGLRTQAGWNSYLHLLLMMDVSGHSRSVYTRPVLRFGVMF